MSQNTSHAPSGNTRKLSEGVPNMNPHNLEVGSEIIKGDRALTIESIRGDTIRFR